jgi:2-succinyl-6-hydroxy-2,4-cyclohexadiene-1-carboxylate synthase
MQRGSAWLPVAARVGRQRRTALVDLPEPSLDACVDAIRQAAGGGAAVAYSLGGRIALHAAVRHPRAFRALVLVGATPGIEDDGTRRSRRAADEALAEWMDGQRIDVVVDFWESQAVFATQDPDLVVAQRPGRLEHDPRALAAMLRATGQGALEPLWGRLAEVVVPVLAIAGERDKKYAAAAERMADELPYGSAAIVPDAGHAVQLEQPELVAELVGDFLDEHLGQRGLIDPDS